MPILTWIFHCVSFVELSFQLRTIDAALAVALSAVATQLEGAAGATARASGLLAAAANRQSSPMRSGADDIMTTVAGWVAGRKKTPCAPLCQAQVEACRGGRGARVACP